MSGKGMQSLTDAHCQRKNAPLLSAGTRRQSQGPGSGDLCHFAQLALPSGSGIPRCAGFDGDDRVNYPIIGLRVPGGP